MIKYEKRKNERYNVLQFRVKIEDDKKTVWSVLKKNGVSLSLIRSLKHCENGIMQNGKEAKTVDTVNEGDIIELHIPQDEKTAVPADIDCDVIYEDEYLAVLNKPAGMTVHPVKEYRLNTLANAFAEHMRKSGREAAFRPVNRLDKDTSGLVVAAKDRFCAAALSGKTDKTYFAVCYGITEKSGIIDAPLGVEENHGIKRCVKADGDRAVTRYETVCSGSGMSFVRVKIETGRTHQIRAHFAYIGHPLAGDDMYGGKRDLIGRQALHCGEISFIHPVTGKRISLKADMPEDMRKILSLVSSD